MYVPKRAMVLQDTGHPSGPVLTYPAQTVSSREDCALLARVLVEQRRDELESGWLVEGDDTDSLRCDWRSLGVKARALTAEERAGNANLGVIQPDGSGGFTPVVLVGKPRYSLLRTRALVPTGVAWGMDGGSGEDCFFTRTLTGWRFDRCVSTWIA